MHLPPAQTARFYRIWFALLHYVNAQRQLLPSFPATPDEATIAPADAKHLRDALWADDTLRETFVAENPAALPPSDLALVTSWRYRLADSFYIFRYLKKYTVFLSHTTPIRAYGVLGLVSPLEEIVGPYVPIYVEAVLLPWEGQIIYDSLLTPYAISFGPGIRRSLNEAYRNAQEGEGIITNLLPPAPASPQEVWQNLLARNTKLLTAFRKDLARTGLSLKMVEQHTGNIARFAQTTLTAQEPPRGLLDLTVADVQAYLTARGASANVVSVKRFVRFLAATGRLDDERAEALHEYLKHVRQ